MACSDACYIKWVASTIQKNQIHQQLQKWLRSSSMPSSSRSTPSGFPDVLSNPKQSRMILTLFKEESRHATKDLPARRWNSIYETENGWICTCDHGRFGSLGTTATPRDHVSFEVKSSYTNWWFTRKRKVVEPEPRQQEPNVWPQPYYDHHSVWPLYLLFKLYT